MNEEQKNNLIKIAIYLGILVIIIILIRFGNFDNNSSKTKQPNGLTNNIEDKIKEINDLYYTMNIHLITDDDAITLQYQKINNIEIGQKKYHKTITEYTKVDNNYYKLDGDTFIKLNNFIDFEYDKTFLNITNIKKLLDLGDKIITNYEEDKMKLTKTISLTDVIKIYNEYNNSQIVIYEDGTITLNIIYNNDNELDFIKLDMTDLYNNINKTNLDKIIYKMTITSNKEEDASWILEKIN